MDNNVIYTGNTRYSIYDNDKRRKIGDKYVPYDAEIEYLQSSGTQYIDTGISTKNNFVGIDTYITFLYYTHDKWAAGYNNYSGGGRSGLQIGTYNNNLNFGLYNADRSVSYGHTIPYDSNTHHYTINCLGVGLALDDEIIQTNQCSNLGTYGGNIHLFQRGGNIGTNYRPGLCKIRETKIYLNNDQIVRDFIPVRVGLVGYMYDKISGQLFGNSGTGNFILGPDKGKKFPYYDAKIEYIQNTATGGLQITFPSYHMLNDKFKIKIEFMRKANNTNWSRVAFNSFFAFWIKNNGILFNYCGTETGITATSASLNERVSVTFSKGSYTTSWGYTGTVPKGTSTTTTSNYIAWFTNSTYNRSGVNAIYNIQIWDEDENLILDLIPVRVNNDAYVYDKCSGRMLDNTGTGVFTQGPDIELTMYDSEVEYLKSSGSGSRINLGIYLDSKAYIELKFSPTAYTYRPYGGINNNNNDFSMRCVDRTLRFYYGTLSSSAYNMPQPNLNSIYTAILNGNNYALYNSSGTALLTGSFTESNFDSQYPCCLFGYNNKGSVNNALIVIRHCIIKNKDRVFDLIPVRKGTVGYMYDKISGKLFAGTSSFTLGPDVTN